MFCLVQSQLLHIIFLSHEFSQVKTFHPLTLELQKVRFILNDTSRLNKFQIGLGQVIWVEALIVDIDSLNVLHEVVLLVNSIPESFLADRTIAMIAKPLIYAFAVKYVEAIEHATHRFIFDWLQADGALTGEEVAIL